MEKYINKAAILAEIERIYNEDYKFLPSDLVESVQDFKDDLLLAINNLEVKKVNSEFLKKHFEETPQKELDKEWKEIEPLNDIGPDVLEYADKIKNG